MRKSRRRVGRGVCLAVVVLVLSAGVASGRIRTLPIPELIAQSDFIVVGRVGEVKKTGEVPKGGGRAEETLENTVLPKEVLKGRWPKGKPMHFTTRRLVHKGKRVWREDELTFPETGSGVLVFVKRDPEGRLRIVNGIQGLWPMGKDGRPMGMGYGYTVEGLKREIAGSLPGGGLR
ncbi:MAG TPA: hypothetical protein PLM79_07105 [Syntrophobacteraceae bacterium]|nr:hypothetical protein [Syntrophobacteraceae bacterium]